MRPRKPAKRKSNNPAGRTPLEDRSLVRTNCTVRARPADHPRVRAFVAGLYAETPTPAQAQGADLRANSA